MGSCGVLWKFRGSSASFNFLECPECPLEARRIRALLLEAVGLPRESFVDFVLYSSADPDRVLSDNYKVPQNAKIEARRCSKLEAEKLVSEANALYQKQIDTSKKRVDSSNSAEASEQCPGSSVASQKQEEKEHDIDDADEIHINAATEDFDESQFHFKCSDDEYDVQENSDKANADADDAAGEESKIQAAMMENNDYYQTVERESLSRRYYRTKAAAEQTAASGGLPSTASSALTDYVCHMCGLRGHHIKNCAQAIGKRLQKKVKNSLGIPVDFLVVIDPKDIDKYDEVYSTKDGEFAILKDASSVSSEAYFGKSIAQRLCENLGIAQGRDSTKLAQGFTCQVCKCVFNNPVTLLCCGSCFCHECVVENATSVQHRCPKCKKNITSAQIQPNTSIKKALEAVVLETNSHVALKAKRQQADVNETNKGANAAKPAKNGFKATKRQKILTSNYISSFLKTNK